MNARHCCQIKTQTGDNAHRPAARLRRVGEIAGWFVSTVTLALLPKCPACLAAYVALATGIGISLPTATLLANDARDIVRGVIGFHHWKTIAKFHCAEIFGPRGQENLAQTSVLGLSPPSPRLEGAGRLDRHRGAQPFLSGQYKDAPFFDRPRLKSWLGRTRRLPVRKNLIVTSLFRIGLPNFGTLS